MDNVNLKVGETKISMVHIPGGKDCGGFYISETPVTVEQFRSLSSKDKETEEWIEYLEEFHKSEYKDFSIMTAYTVQNVLHFFNGIKHRIFFCLPSKEQWLHLFNTHFDQVTWCKECEYRGWKKKSIDWEMTRDNRYNIYCLLGYDYDEQGKRFITGNNFVKSQERDNIGFRLVCSEWDMNNYLNQ